MSKRLEAALFLSELDKTDRLAETLSDRLQIECPHEEPAVPGDFLEALEDALEPGSASRLRGHLKAIIREVLNERTDISDMLGK